MSYVDNCLYFRSHAFSMLISKGPEKLHDLVVSEIGRRIKKSSSFRNINGIQQQFYMTQVQEILKGFDPIRDRVVLNAIGFPHYGSIHISEALASYEFWQLVSQLYNTKPIFVASAIGDVLLNINIESCFHTVPLNMEHLQPFCNLRLAHCDLIEKFYYQSQEFKLNGIDWLLDADLQIRANACRYSSNAENIIVYTGRNRFTGYDYLSLGGARCPNRPFGYEAALAKPLPCLISTVPDIGFSLRQHYSAIKSGVVCNFHMLAFYDPIEKMNWSDLINQEIILLCSPDREEWDHLTDLCKAVKQYPIKSLAVYTFPISGDFIHKGSRQISDESYRLLSERGIDLNQYEKMTSIGEKIIKDAVSLDDLKEFEKQYGINKDCKEKEQTKVQFSTIDFKDLTTYEAAPSSPPTLREVITPSFTSLLYGSTDVGKSFLIIDLCIGLATGEGRWGFKPSAPAKVVYLDGEMGNLFLPRVRQLVQQLEAEQKELVSTNLRFLSKDVSGLFDQDIATLFDLIKGESPDIVTFDNLLSIFPNATRPNNDRFFAFINNLKQMGIAPILIHHTGKSGDDYLGPAALGALSQNVLRIDDLKEDSEACQAYTEASAGKGPLARLTIEKAKNVPYLKNEHIDLWLPAGGVWNQLSQWPEYEAEVKNEAAIMPGANETLLEKAKTLKPRERKAYEHILANPGGVERCTIDELLQCCENTSREILNSLKAQRLIVSEGEGKATCYKPILAA